MSRRDIEDKIIERAITRGAQRAAQENEEAEASNIARTLIFKILRRQLAYKRTIVCFEISLNCLPYPTRKHF